MQPLGPAHLLNPKEAQKLNLSVLKRIDAATEQVHIFTDYTLCIFISAV